MERAWLPNETRVLVDLVDDIDGYQGTEGGAIIGLSDLNGNEPSGWTRYRIRKDDGYEVLAWPEWVQEDTRQPAAIDLSY